MLPWEALILPAESSLPFAVYHAMFKG